jgi:hypothetical protein
MFPITLIPMLAAVFLAWAATAALAGGIVFAVVRRSGGSIAWATGVSLVGAAIVPTILVSLIFHLPLSISSSYSLQPVVSMISWVPVLLIMRSRAQLAQCKADAA